MQKLTALTIPALLACTIFTSVGAGQTTAPTTMDAAPLIPRATFFGNPDRAGPQISPDGKHIAFLADSGGKLNVFVAPADKPDEARAVTNDTARGIRQYFWAYTSEHLIYLQDQGGNENWRVYSVNLGTGAVKDLTPFDGVRANIEGVSEKIPTEIIVGLNRRVPQLHDLYRVNISTGELTPVLENPGFVGFVTDDAYNVRFAMRFAEDGGMEVVRNTGDNASPDWKPFERIPMEDTNTTSPVGFDKTGNVLYMLDSRERNTAALFAVNLETGDRTLIAQDDRADVSGTMQHPTTKKIEAVASTYLKREWQFLDPAIRADFERLRAVETGEVSVISRTLDDATWIVQYMHDAGPARWYRYERSSGKATYLFSNRKSLEGLPLAPMHAVEIKSRDGLNLVSYLTLPVWATSDNGVKPVGGPLPMVLLVHGGPWARDNWGFNGVHQWLSNRGYAVLSVNFRGSTGLGKEFLNAGNREWAAKMHDDLLDAVNWAVESGIAKRDKVAIMGGSYGGYATLVGVTFTPDVFACGVSIVGPSNIVTLLNTIPPYWAPMVQMFKDRVGDHTTEDGRAFLESRSPLNFVDRIRRPLLIGQGANDPRVKQSESDQIVQAMQKHNIPVTYVLFPDEGHGFARPENNMAFFAVTEAFLAGPLGGRFQPIGGDVEASTAQVPAGAEFVPGLSGGAAKPVGN